MEDAHPDLLFPKSSRFLANPFPASNPIVPASGQGLGVYSPVGNQNIDVAYEGHQKALSDRMPKIADSLIGDWDLSGIVTWHSDDYLNFPGNPLQLASRCNVYASTPGTYFNTSCFSQLPAFTERANRWVFSCLTGPSFFNVDATLFKEFSITERIKTKLHASAFNALNNLNLGDPDLNVFDSLFGKSIYQAPNITGRCVELGLKLTF